MTDCIDISPEQLGTWLQPRPRDCHKGDFGNIGILGGAPGMAGAGLLAARAALWLGAGRVHAGLLDERVAVDPMAPEVMICSPEHCLGLAMPGCLVVGPGLGSSGSARQAMERAIGADLPLLLDADALNLLASDPYLRQALRRRVPPSLITPHPGEAGRLLGGSATQVQADRVEAANALVTDLRCVVVLKGADTLVATPEGGLWRNTTGNPGMAAPGMGDVLAGMIGALLGQGLGAEAQKQAERAALTGVWLHGAAADALVAEGHGPVGLSAGEVPAAARRQLNRLLGS